MIGWLSELLSDLVVDLLMPSFASGRRPADPTRSGAERRLDEYRQYRVVFVPVQLRGADIGIGTESFEIAVIEGENKPRFDWWDPVLMGDFGVFLRSLADAQLEPDGTVKGTCFIPDGRAVRVELQRDDLNILARVFRA